MLDKRGTQYSYFADISSDSEEMEIGFCPHQNEAGGNEQHPDLQLTLASPQPRIPVSSNMKTDAAGLSLSDLDHTQLIQGLNNLQLAKHKPKNRREIDSRSVHVSNIPHAVTSTSLRQLFCYGTKDIEGCGCESIKKVLFPTDQATNMSKGHAFIEFLDARVVEQAIKFDGFEFAGQPIAVGRKGISRLFKKAGRRATRSTTVDSPDLTFSGHKETRPACRHTEPAWPHAGHNCVFYRNRAGKMRRSSHRSMGCWQSHLPRSGLTGRRRGDARPAYYGKHVYRGGNDHSHELYRGTS